MGIRWKFTMVLLSTLAALVIIVHSAEEDYEMQYQHDLRPRALDTGTPSYDQPWREVEVEHMMQQSTPSEIWTDNSQEERPRRRRNGRKRKRRPQPSSAEDFIPQERYAVYPDEPLRPYIEVDPNDSHQTTETPKRIRKKLESRTNRWTEASADRERPLRRRGQRRKRPSLDTWSDLSEFSGHRLEEIPRESDTRARTKGIQLAIEDGQDNEERPQTHFLQIQSETNAESVEQKAFEIKPDFHQQEDSGEDSPTVNEGRYHNNADLKEDSSLSEFSLEVPGSIGVPKIHDDRTMRGKLRDKSKIVFKEFEKAEDNLPIDPLTLKDILKKSNGTSLSEILQQHNLSLADLLHGKENAISILKSEDLSETENGTFPTKTKDLLKSEQTTEANTAKKGFSENKLISNSEINDTTDSTVQNYTDSITEKTVTSQTIQNIQEDVIKNDMQSLTIEKPHLDGNYNRNVTRRRFPANLRRKLRMRPMLNTTYKSPLSRDLISLNARKHLYLNNRRNATKSKEWKDVIPMMMKKKHIQNDYKKVETEMSTIAFEETTVVHNFEIDNSFNLSEETQINPNNKLSDIINDEILLPAAKNTTNGTVIDDFAVNVTEKPTVTPILSHAVNASGLRRQAFNNRIKKKRLKQKQLTTEPPQDDIMKNLFGMANLVSSSEFVAQTQTPTNLEDSHEFITALEDFITTEKPSVVKKKSENKSKLTEIFTISSTSPKTFEQSTTEEIAKIEIEELLNDNRTSARLSRILMERNMTLSQLVEHRERGSSYVHLADIFHNTSKEPNPPEPFLSKSVIEPISKETYPLRALLDANTHDATAKASTIEPNLMDTSYYTIPVVMDFGNNVNENAENMGIMSLFNNFTKSDNSPITKDSDGTPYETSIISVNTTDISTIRDSKREGRVLNYDNRDDIVSWNELFSLMRKKHKNETDDALKSYSEEVSRPESFKKPTLEEDVDGDGLIVLEDLQHLKDFGSNIASTSDEKIEVNPYERTETPAKLPGIIEKVPQTKSVTVATACIAGLAMVLFLLTYAVFKWKQQRSLHCKKRSFCDERIPTPVFENRKGHRNNSSTRSISPMLSTSNIYTLNTLDSRNGKESPDYMWDTLRKPFQ